METQVTEIFEELVNLFMQDLRDKSRSELTVAAYGSDLRGFGEYLTEVGYPATFPHVSVLPQMYMGYFRSRGLADATITRKLTCLRTFYDFLVRTGRCEANPFRTIKSPRSTKPLPKVLTVEQAVRLLEAPPADTWIGARDRLMFHLLYSSGMRVSELVSLDLQDLNMAEMTARVRNSHGGTRTVPLRPAAMEALRLYLRNRARQFKSDEAMDYVPLLVNKDGKRISQRSVRRKLDLYLRQIGFDMEISPHTLRHTCAVHMLKAGADPEEVRQRLGHQSMQQVRQYQAMLER